ncbi:hypothetical protein L208DRAFT_1417080 [Tricholoma matsutake]|nr:hypothetical protein L208DRAFT_1417080 [Tricholoma matsutake 945]
MMWAPFLLFNPKLHVISMVALLNARKYPSDETMISVGNVSGTPSRNPNLFMSKSDTDGSRDINPRTLHLRGLSDGGQRFIQHPMPSLTHQDKHGDVLKIHGRRKCPLTLMNLEVLEISVEKSVQVTRS